MLPKSEYDEHIVYLRRLINFFLISMIIYYLAKNLILPYSSLSFFKLFILIILAGFCQQTLKKLYYTYWTFALIFLVLILFDVVPALWFRPWFGLVGIVIVACYLATNYFLASPIYYPQVNWWEYDFRFRTDLRGKVFMPDGKEYECRVADLRRNAACVHSFENLPTGTVLRLEVLLDNITKSCNAKIISTRRGIPGRPSIYGVQFSKKERGVYREICTFWKQVSLAKQGDKFKKVQNG